MRSECSAHCVTPDRPTCSDDDGERGQSPLTRVAEAPTVVLGAVDEIDVAGRPDGDRRHAASLRVLVQALHDQHLVVEAVTHVRLVRRHVHAAVVT